MNAAFGAGSYSCGRCVRLIQAVRTPKAAAPMTCRWFDEAQMTSPGAILKRSVTSAMIPLFMRAERIRPTERSKPRLRQQGRERPSADVVDAGKGNAVAHD